MRITFYGTRGSIPTPGEKTLKYGGNTPCVEIRADDTLIILDAGSGIRELGLKLMEEFSTTPIKGHLFITHTHWDHIQGLPFFLPMMDKNNQFDVYGCSGFENNLENRLKLQMETDYFPIGMNDFHAAIQFHNLKGPDIAINNAIRVDYIYMNHPGLTLGYRITHKGRSVVFATDNEPYSSLTRSINDESQKLITELDAQFIKFIKDTDLLIADGQYTAEEYTTKVGWGHCSIDAAIELSDKANVKRCAIFHHDPMHTDDFLDDLATQYTATIKSKNSPIDFFFAEEGRSIKL